MVYVDWEQWEELTGWSCPEIALVFMNRRQSASCVLLATCSPALYLDTVFMRAAVRVAHRILKPSGPFGKQSLCDADKVLRVENSFYAAKDSFPFLS